MKVNVKIIEKSGKKWYIIVKEMKDEYKNEEMLSKQCYTCGMDK